VWAPGRCGFDANNNNLIISARIYFFLSSPPSPFPPPPSLTPSSPPFLLLRYADPVPCQRGKTSPGDRYNDNSSLKSCHTPPPPFPLLFLPPPLSEFPFSVSFPPSSRIQMSISSMGLKEKMDRHKLEKICLLFSHLIPPFSPLGEVFSPPSTLAGVFAIKTITKILTG